LPSAAPTPPPTPGRLSPRDVLASCRVLAGSWGRRRRRGRGGGAEARQLRLAPGARVCESRLPHLLAARSPAVPRRCCCYCRCRRCRRRSRRSRRCYFFCLRGARAQPSHRSSHSHSLSHPLFPRKRAFSQPSQPARGSPSQLSCRTDRATAVVAVKRQSHNRRGQG
jgi:hypothetical protein